MTAGSDEPTSEGNHGTVGGWLMGSRPNIHEDPWSSLNLTRKTLRASRYVFLAVVLFEGLTWPVFAGFMFIGLLVLAGALIEVTILVEVRVVKRQLKDRAATQL